MKHMNKENLKYYNLFIRDYGLSDLQANRFRVFIDLLETWQTRTKLVSKNDVNKLVCKHVVESVQFLTPKPFFTNSVILDLGSGAGFPGIPLSIMRPDCRFYLVESRRMKVLFLKEVKQALQLDHVNIAHTRVENISLPDKVDCVVARAVTRLEQLWKWSEPLLKKQGVLLAQKGGSVQGELDAVLKPESQCTCSVFDVKNKKVVVVKRKESL